MVVLMLVARAEACPKRFTGMTGNEGISQGCAAGAPGLPQKVLTAMDKKLAALVLGAMSLSMVPMMAQAYIGPGVGAGAIGAVIGVIGSIFLAIFAVLWYPIKRMLKGKKKSPQADKTASK